MAYSKEEINKAFRGQSELMAKNARLSNSKTRPDGYIYIVMQKGFEGVFKIGVSSNPKRRVWDLDSANPFGVELIYKAYFKNVYNLEECIHDSFKENLLRKEWFKLNIEDERLLIEDITKLSNEGVYLTRRENGSTYRE